ncbi:hypothetical protein MVEN_00572300 [Mycena venus]|uniref:Uncharacterized protein n=1 Tax=Mycena venus TaxID=2733690 RepID=A0A8H7D4S9_9AGAR|nr:hypothetical protein MVEN_00572300 [Mycena venus]
MQQDYSMEVDLCELLHGLKLGNQESLRLNGKSLRFAVDNGDSSMLEAQTFHPNETLHLRPDSPSEPPYHGCAYLQTIQSQLDSEKFPTTGGEYIEAIFTHRQIFFAFPGGHRSCAIAFSDIACHLQRREWRADREADMEAVTAFNYEAQFIASVIG